MQEVPEIIYNRPKMTPYQTAILDSPARFTVTEAATKTGKTASHIIWLHEQPLALDLKDGQAVWWVAPVYGQAEIAFNRMKRLISDKDYFKVNEGKLTLTLPTGAIIQFKSADKPDNLYGDDVYAAVFDEFTRAKEEAWFALRSTLTATKGRCKFIGNVKGKKNWGYKLAQRAKAGESNHEHFKITAYDAAKEGILSFEEIEEAKRDLPESVFKELYLAEPSEDGSNPFGLQYIGQCIYQLSTLPAVCFGIDLAKYKDWTVIIGLDKFGQVCHFERFQRDWRQTVQAIKSLPNVPMKIDSTGVGDPIVEQVQEGRGNVFGVKFTQFTKQQLMEGLAVAIQSKKIFFPEGIITDELEYFEFEHTRTGVRYAAPAGFTDDCVCALALAQSIHSESATSGSYSWA